MLWPGSATRSAARRSWDPCDRPRLPPRRSRARVRSFRACRSRLAKELHGAAHGVGWSDRAARTRCCREQTMATTRIGGSNEPAGTINCRMAGAPREALSKGGSTDLDDGGPSARVNPSRSPRTYAMLARATQEHAVGTRQPHVGAQLVVLDLARWLPGRSMNALTVAGPPIDASAAHRAVRISWRHQSKRGTCSGVSSARVRR